MIDSANPIAAVPARRSRPAILLGIVCAFALQANACAAPPPSSEQAQSLNRDRQSINRFTKSTVVAIVQTGSFATGIAESGELLPVASIDPAGAYYSDVFSGLLIVDSEINEVPEAFDQIGATLFASSISGDATVNQWDLTQITGNEPFRNREPTGITYCPGDGHYYITNDDLKLIYRYALVDDVFIAVDSVSTSSYTLDPEGITCDPNTGRLYVIGGTAANIGVYIYDEGFILLDVLDLQVTAGHPDGQLSDAEGIAYDTVSGHLFVVSDPIKSIVEYLPNGRYVRTFDIRGFTPTPIAPQGLTIGPSSTNPLRQSFYIADGGLDNDMVPEERDGRIYEALIERLANQRP